LSTYIWDAPLTALFWTLFWTLFWNYARVYGEGRTLTSPSVGLARAIASRDLHSKHSSPIVFIESGLEPLVLYADLGGFVSAQ
jgi:hypothetical protein